MGYLKISENNELSYVWTFIKYIEILNKSVVVQTKVLVENLKTIMLHVLGI